VKRVFFHVQHLLGIGHLKRAAVLCRAFAAAGFDVTLASGGAPVAGLFPGRVVQLPPMAAADATFRNLVDERGASIDEQWKRRRAEATLRAWKEARADVLVVELFPFGRRQLGFELLPLLEAARGALVVCSVRELLQRRPEREAQALEMVEAYFDHVLVHGDPRVARFDATFSAAGRIAAKIAYTGYVVEAAPARESELGKSEVLVSAGGGAVGRRLLETAIEARPLTRLAGRTWRLLAGRLEKAALPEGIIVDPFRNDFTMLLRNCELSVSQAGYNTVMETLQARARAVVVPFSQGSETEQGMRARLMGEKGLLEVLEEKDLSAQALAAAIDRAASRPRPRQVEIDMDGARASAELLRQWTA